MTIYCNQLGMLTAFSYCTSVNNGMPCRNIIGCWRARCDILAFLRKHFTDDQLRDVFSGIPRSRIDRIIDVLRESGKYPPRSQD